MVKILTACEALLFKAAFEDALDILEDHGYDYEASQIKEALKVLKGLLAKNIEDVIS